MRNARGLSLIEALVALAILLVGMMGFTVAFTHTMMKSKSVRSDSQALFLATSLVEELKARNFDDWDSAADLNALAANFNVNYYGELDPANPYYQVEADSVSLLNDNARRVVITVTWSGWSQEQEQAGLSDRLVDGQARAFVYEAIISRLVGETIYGEDD